MFKNVALSLIFTVCALMGMIKRNDLFRRVEALDGFIAFAERVRNEILHRKRPIDAILDDAADINDFFQGFCVSEVYPLFKRYEALKSEFATFSYMKREDISVIDEMFRFLGKSDALDQGNKLEAILRELKVNRSLAYDEYRKKGSVFVKTGLAIGAFAVVICI